MSAMVMDIRQRPIGSSIRLTRAGRLARSGAVAVALVAAGLVTLGQGVSSAAGVPQRVTVAPGDTLSGLADRYLPELSVAAGIEVIRAANDMPNSQVRAGQVLTIPAH